MHTLARSFAGDRTGSVAVIFALLSVPFFGIASAAIDYGRALRVETMMQAATEAAASAAAQRLGEPEAPLSQIVRTALDANLPRDLQGITYQLSVEGDNAAVRVQIASTVPTMMAGIIGIQDFKVQAESFARRPQLVRTEPAVASRSGSGRTPSPSEARDAMQAAARSDAAAQARRALQSGDLSGLEAQMRRLVEMHGGDKTMPAPRPEDLARLRRMLGH